ncbi:RNA polymerase sigma factor (sigma-70 family) [Leucobacter exalbidus]|uniref:RNA polymerase sigma factor (Sigma-70 family) n=1 Tax=Leucobacter exalbidus TaxID=662960 RepID=A0A940PXK9_9MICO|nr:sigma-70 family RNA polymerase sigma factor [Leucobacter exalbidus]MBP1327219.1 RNA polymerase sigma factor (sigma-70 family) [Leucobacter exalbidus]
MSKGLDLAHASDMALVELSRGGFNDAFAELWKRHSGAVIAATRSFTGFDPDDVVQETFTRIFDQIQSGQGPQTAFRAYAMVTARNIATNMARKHSNNEVTGAADEVFEHTDRAPKDMADTVLSNSFTLGVFSSLPTKWQEALWYRDVEDLPINQCSSFLGLNENATTALVKRAREGFKQAWIAANITPASQLSPECEWFVEKLPKYVRGRAPATVTKRIEAHLATCHRCAIVAEESQNVHKRLALILLPLFLGGHAAAGYLAWIQAGHNQVAVAAHAVQGLAVHGTSAKIAAVEAVSIKGAAVSGAAHFPVAVVAAASAGVVAVAVVAVTFLGGTAAEPPRTPGIAQGVDEQPPAKLDQAPPDAVQTRPSSSVEAPAVVSPFGRAPAQATPPAASDPGPASEAPAPAPEMPPREATPAPEPLGHVS